MIYFKSNVQAKWRIFGEDTLTGTTEAIVELADIATDSKEKASCIGFGKESGTQSNKTDLEQLSWLMIDIDGNHDYTQDDLEELMESDIAHIGQLSHSNGIHLFIKYKEPFGTLEKYQASYGDIASKLAEMGYYVDLNATSPNRLMYISPHSVVTNDIPAFDLVDSIQVPDVTEKEMSLPTKFKMKNIDELIDICSDYMVEGSRHNTLMAISGLLRRNRINATTTYEVVHQLSTNYREDNLDTLVSDTYSKPSKAVAGYNMASDIFSEEDLKKIMKIISVNSKVELDDVVGSAYSYIDSTNLYKHPDADVYYSVNGKLEEIKHRQIVIDSPHSFSMAKAHHFARVVQSHCPSLNKGDDKNNEVYFSNGKFNLKEMKFEEYSDDSRYLYQVSGNYQRNDILAKPVIDFVNSLVDTDIKRNTLFQLITVSMTRKIPKRMFMLYGKKDSGKSAFLNLLEKMLGTYNVANQSLYSITKERFAKSELEGKLANIFADIGDEKIMKHSVIKSITGGDRISIERKGIDSYSTKLSAKLIFSANDLPEIIKSDEAFRERLIVVQFPYKFVDSNYDNETTFQKNTGIVDSFTDEQIAAFKAWLLNNFGDKIETDDFVIDEADKEYIDEIADDPLDVFVKEECFLEEGTRTTINELYLAYKAYYEDLGGNNNYILNKRTFGKEMKKRFGVQTDRGRQVNGVRKREYIGIRLDEMSEFNPGRFYDTLD